MKGFLIVIALFLACSLKAQMDVIVLKNGSEIRGVVIEKTEASVKLKTKDGSIWVFHKDEVVEIKEYSPIVAKTGYYANISGGILGGSDVSTNVMFVNGYRINEHWAAGVGIGVESFYGRSYLPVFFEGKYNLLKKSSTPFLSLGVGYDFPFEFTDTRKGGLLGQGFLGFQHEMGQHFGIITGIGFRYGRLKVDNWSWWNDGSAQTTYLINRFDLRFGFIFR
ncbi:MAG: hypothetical protein AB8B72_08200 [Crocinitomicaceae bacterium]